MTKALPVRLAVVLSHPTQYYSPWFQWLQAHSALRFRVFYLWDFGVRQKRDPQFQTSFAWDVDLLSGYDHEFVPNLARHQGTDRFSGLINPALISRLHLWQPDAVLLFGYAYFSHLALIAWARLRGVPLIFRGDSHLLGRDQPGWLARTLLGLLYRQFTAFACVGAANRDYFRSFGVPPERLVFAPHAVNSAHFSRTASALEAARTLRQRLGLAESTRVILFAGKFTPAKQPLLLLRAFARLPRTDAALVFVGDGEEKAALLAAAARLPAGLVHFLPFANQSEMPARYLMAHAFVLPSRGCYETWGLAVNEAMHLGVPSLVSDRVGCQQDLVTPGETGWVFRAEDEADLRNQLAAALAADLSAMRPRVLQRIAKYEYRQSSAGLQRALDLALGATRPTA